jgi:hypothetical protein
LLYIYLKDIYFLFIFQAEVKRQELEVQMSVISLEEASDSSQLVPVGKHPVKTTIDQFMPQKGEQAKYPCNSDLQKRFDLELITMIATTNCSYNFVDQDGFKHFMHYVAPKYTVKGRHSKSRELTPLLHKNVKAAKNEIFAKELPHCKNVAFTDDELQSREFVHVADNTLHQKKVPDEKDHDRL